jgi:HSP20 family protein
MAGKGREKKESKALTTRKTPELIPRREELDRWFDRMVEEFWHRPVPGLFHPERWWPARAVSVPSPALDVYEEKDEVVVKAELPGMAKEEIEVNLAGDVLTIKGEKKKEEEIKEEDYRYRERSYGSFVRSLELPCEVKADQVKATFKDGVLEVRLPKTEEAKKQSVAVKID